MGLRFRKSVRIAPGVRINLSKSGGSVSVGGRGASVNVGKRGAYTNFGLPGTGASYRQEISGRGARGGRPGDVSRRTVWLMFGLLFLWIVFLVVHHWPGH
jgi:hypothetical protein